MASSPASPAPSCVKDGGLGQWNLEVPPGGAKPGVLALTSILGTPAGSVLRTNARRVVQQSAIKEMAGANKTLQGALDHFSMFDKVTALESENTELKSKVRELTEQVNVAVDRASAAEAAAAEAQAATATQHNTAGQSGSGADATDLATASKAQLITLVKELQQEVMEVQQERRKAHNLLVEQKGAIRVICRVRPIASTALNPHAVRALADGSTVSVNCYGQDTSFNFSRVFGPASTQQQVFSEVSELVQSSLDGFNVCLMSYGQTGSGKTYSMLGGAQDALEHKGIIPRAIDKLMESVSRLGRQGWKYQLEASCMEIYNSGLRDLLASSPAKEITDMNAIKHDAEGGTSVIGVSRHEISSTSQALSLLQQASEARAVNATACNAASSRSHCVFWLHIRGSHSSDGTQLSGALCLVDLAGSERLERSGAQGERKAETAAINSSLSSLGDVFEALAQKRQHVPYRNSKLTYLLQKCLSRGGKTLFLVHINPESGSAYESLTSLRFATKVSGTELGQANRKVAHMGVPLIPPPVAIPPAQLAPAPVAARRAGALMQRAEEGGRRAKTRGWEGVGTVAKVAGVQQQAQHVGRKRSRAGGDVEEAGADQQQVEWQGAGEMQFGSSGQLCHPVVEEEQEEQEDDGEVLDLRAALRRKRQGLGGDAALPYVGAGNRTAAVAPSVFKGASKGAWK